MALLTRTPNRYGWSFQHDSDRTSELRVLVSDAELALLDQRRAGLSRAAYMRSLLRDPPTELMATHEESLGLLSGMARSGSVTAAINLERALRNEETGQDELDREIDRLMWRD